MKMNWIHYFKAFSNQNRCRSSEINNNNNEIVENGIQENDSEDEKKNCE